jgi:hypothetical protein
MRWVTEWSDRLMRDVRPHPDYQSMMPLMAIGKCRCKSLPAAIAGLTTADHWK